MADFNQPTLSSQYADHHDQLKARDVDAYTLAESPTNPPTGAIRYNRSLNKFQEWNGSSWIDKVISLAGGGTGGADANSARTSLGLGTMAIQNNNAVAITGGTIVGITSLDVVGNPLISGRVDILSGAANAIDVAGGITAGSGDVGIIDTTGKIPAINSTYFASLVMTGDFSISSSLSLPTIVLNGNDPQLIWREADGPLDEKNYRVISNAGNLLFQGLNDAVGGAVNYIVLERTGTALDLITVGSHLKINPQGLGFSGSLYFADSNYYISGGDGRIEIQTLNAPRLVVGSPGSGFNTGIDTYPVGVGQVGPSFKIGFNSSGTGAPGVLVLQAKDGNDYYLWVDTTGNLRVGVAPPAEGFSDTIGTVVGTQS